MNYQKRINIIKNQCKEKKLDAVLISSVPNITYITGFSHFSKEEREAFVLLTQDQSYIFTDGRYSEAVQEQVSHCIFVEISSAFPFTKSLTQLVKKHNLARIGFEHNNMTVSEYKRISSVVELSPFDADSIRSIKKKEECAFIEKACQLGDEAFEHIVQNILSGISERQLAFELEFFIKRKGADISFPPIVAFGSNSSVPHHQTGNRALKKGDIVLLDFGATVNNYCSDMTRTLFFGEASEQQKKIYTTVLEAQQKAIECLQRISFSKEILCAKDVDKVARDYIVSKGYPTIPHSLGHGIGLEVHESPRLSPASKERLTQGMVFSIEPGIYIPGFGGVRIEDLFVIEKESLRQLTHASKECTEIA